MVGESDSITRLRTILKEFEKRIPNDNDKIHADNVKFYLIEGPKFLEDTIICYYEITEANSNEQTRKLAKNIIQSHRRKILNIVNKFTNNTDFMVF